jgi:hypothetical protein
MVPTHFMKLLVLWGSPLEDHHHLLMAVVNSLAYSCVSLPSYAISVSQPSFKCPSFLNKLSAHICLHQRSVSKGTWELPAPKRIRLKEKNPRPTQIDLEGPEYMDSREQREWSRGHLHIEEQGDLVAWAQNDQGTELSQYKRSADTLVFSAKEPVDRIASRNECKMTQ